MSRTELRRAATLYGAADDNCNEVLVLDPVATSDEVLQYSDGRPGDPVARIERIARDLAAPPGDERNGPSVGHFMEAKILFENDQMRNTLDAINVIFGHAGNRDNPSEIISIVGQSQVELTSIRSELTLIRGESASIHANRFWRAFVFFSKLKRLMKTYIGFEL